MLEYFRKAFALGCRRRVQARGGGRSPVGALGHPGTIFITRSELAMNARCQQLARGLRTSGGRFGRRAERRDLWLVGGWTTFPLHYTRRDRGAEDSATKWRNSQSSRFGLRAGARFVAGYLGYQTEPMSPLSLERRVVLNMLRSMLVTTSSASCCGAMLMITPEGRTTAGFQKVAEELYGQQLGCFSVSGSTISEFRTSRQTTLSTRVQEDSGLPARQAGPRSVSHALESRCRRLTSPRHPPSS